MARSNSSLSLASMCFFVLLGIGTAHCPVNLRTLDLLEHGRNATSYSFTSAKALSMASAKPRIARLHFAHIGHALGRVLQRLLPQVPPIRHFNRVVEVDDDVFFSAAQIPKVVRNSPMSVRVCTLWVNSTSSVLRVRSSARYPIAPITTSKTREKTVPK